MFSVSQRRNHYILGLKGTKTVIFLKQAKMYPHKVSKFTDFYTVVVVVGAKRDGTGQTFFIPGLEDRGTRESTYID